MSRQESEEHDEVLDAFDLPHPSIRPTITDLMKFLDILAVVPPSWDDSATESSSPKSVKIIGNPTPWLTSLVSSPLSWLPDDETREFVWKTAGIRLSERCGRSAIPAFDRSFRIVKEGLEVKIHEPTMEGDNLGLKTWGSAYALAKRLASDDFMNKTIRDALNSNSIDVRILELGAGTGLAGIALAATIRSIITLGSAEGSVSPDIQVHLTDLPEVMANLERNVELNNNVISNVKVTTGVLDWRAHESADTQRSHRYPLIIAADSLYSPDHPGLLSTVVDGWLEDTEAARFIVELPLRKLFGGEISDFRRLMLEKGFAIMKEGEEDARDDWGNGGESQRCWWAIYSRRNPTTVA